MTEKYIEYKKQSYLDEFLSLKCSGDVLNIVSPIQNAQKEITESMAVLKKVRKISLKNPMNYILYDFCAGNALTSVLAAHLLPIKQVIAIDNRERSRDWYKAKRFTYEFSDIYDYPVNRINKDSIIVSIHPCSNLAERVIEIYNNSMAEFLILMPCCNGSIRIGTPDLIREKIGKYLIWCWDLASRCIGRVNMVIDSKCLSPKNCILIAKK